MLIEERGIGGEKCKNLEHFNWNLFWNLTTSRIGCWTKKNRLNFMKFRIPARKWEWGECKYIVSVSTETISPYSSRWWCLKYILILFYKSIRVIFAAELVCSSFWSLFSPSCSLFSLLMFQKVCCASELWLCFGAGDSGVFLCLEYFRSWIQIKGITINYMLFNIYDIWYMVYDIWMIYDIWYCIISQSYTCI